MFAVVYSSPAMGPAILDPEVDINFAAMVHGGQEFVWGEPVCAGDEITTRRQGAARSTRRTARASTSSSPSPPTRTATRSSAQPGRTSSAASEEASMAELNEGDAIPELRVTPDKYLPHRYAGRVRRLQPDPHRQRLRPDGRAARATSSTASTRWPRWRAPDRGRRRRSAGPAAPARVQFRGMGVPEEEIVVTGTVDRARRRRRGRRDRGLPGRQRDRPQRRGRAASSPDAARAPFPPQPRIPAC